MTSNELKSLVKEYFNLVEAENAATAVVAEEITEETFGELKDINGAFTIKFPGDSLQVGDKVTVVTTEGQEMGAPDGEHELEDGTKIVTKDSVVEEIISADEEKVDASQVEEKMEEVVVEVEKEEDMPSLEDVVKEIADAVAEQMKSMEEKMAALEAKVDKYMEAPAAEPTITSTGKDIKTGFSKFDVTKAANSKDMELALKMIKNKK